MILNFFRISGDIAHLLSFYFIFSQLRFRKSAAGILINKINRFIIKNNAIVCNCIYITLY